MWGAAVVMPVAPRFFLQKSSQTALSAPPTAPPFETLSRGRSLLKASEIFVIQGAFVDPASRWFRKTPIPGVSIFVVSNSTKQTMAVAQATGHVRPSRSGEWPLEAAVPHWR
jgi:hypothetical protein